MKTINKLAIILLTVINFTACSSDDSDENSQNELQTQLIGKWYFENPLTNGLETNNSFTFTTSGEVTYSYLTSGASFDFDSEVGTYSFNGDIMTMTFPEVVSLTYVQKVVYLNDNVVEFQDTGVAGQNAYDGDYFREE